MKDLIFLLDKLRLTGIKTHLLEREEQPVDGTYELLRSLLKVEHEYKKSRSLHYRLNLAKLPTVKLLSETSQARLVERIDIKQLIDNNQNIILVGGSGSAKTHLAIGLTFLAIQKSYRAKFYTLNELAIQLLNARAHNNEIKFMEAIKRFDIIVIDELGYVPIKPESGSLLFELFAKLYEQTSIIITTHLRFEEWGEIFGNAKATKAIIDRLTHHCKIIETGNKSFRGGNNVK
jgi:DNA replication protein DnaC